MMIFIRTVAALLCLHHVLSVPSGSKTGEEWVYSITASTKVDNALELDVASKWNFEGKLTIQSFEDYKVMKLTRVRSSSYNGAKSAMPAELESFETKNSKQLSEPFVVYYNGSHIEELKFNPKDPVWSTNMKKGIASVFQYDLDLPDKAGISRNVYELEEYIAEKTIHGRCVMRVRREGNTISKAGDHCSYKNVNYEQNKNFDSVFTTGNSNRTYTLNENAVPQIITSVSTHKLICAYEERFLSYIEQTVHFEAKLFQAVQTPIEIKQCTLKKEIEYEYVHTPKVEINNETISDFNKQIETLEQDMKANYTEVTEETFQIIGNVHNFLAEADLPTLKSLGESDNFSSKIVSSMLPYIGSRNTVKLIKELYINDKIKDLTGLLTLARYPGYVHDVSNDLIEELSELLYIHNNNQTLDEEYIFTEADVMRLLARNNYIMGFSNFVKQIYSQFEDESNNKDKKDLIKKYVDIYCDMYADPKNHRSKFSIILGLGNMGRIATDCLVDIAKNRSESSYLRTRAMYAIETTYEYKKSHGGFTSIWPIVQDASNQYELRVAALTVILHARIERHINIYNYLKNLPDDAISQHLYNYFYTFMTSSKKSGFDFPAVHHNFYIKPPQSSKSLMTAFYHISTQDTEADKKFISITNVHFVADPITNRPNTIRITFEHRTQHTVFSYTLFISIRGINYDQIFGRYWRPAMPLQVLFDMVTKHKLKPTYKNDEPYLEVILYEGERPILAIDSKSLDDLRHINFMDILHKEVSYFFDNDLITSQVGKVVVPSDLGTEIAIVARNERMYHSYTNIFTEMLAIYTQDTDYIKGELKFLNKQKFDLECNNPILDINHVVTRFSAKQILLGIEAEKNFKTPYVKWNADDLILDYLHEYRHVAYVEGANSVETYCKNCVQYEFYKLPEHTTMHANGWTTNVGAKRLGFYELECNITEALTEFIPKMLNKMYMRKSDHPIPLLKPIMYFKYIQDYLQYYSFYDVCTFNVLAMEILQADRKDYWTKLGAQNDGGNVTIYLTNYNFDDTVINNYILNFQAQEEWNKRHFSFNADNANNSAMLDLTVSFSSEQTESWKDTLFCSEFAEPTTIDIGVKYSGSDENSNFAFNIENIFSITDHMKHVIYNDIEVSDCQKEKRKRNLLFNPPRRECYKTCLKMSEYNSYIANVEFKQYSPTSSFGILLNTLVAMPFEETEKDENVYDQIAPRIEEAFKNKDKNTEIKQMSLNFIKSEHSSLSINNGERKTTFKMPLKYVDFILLPKPFERIKRDYDYGTLGIDSVCIITPTFVKTFTEEIIEISEIETNIALIECDDSTRAGVLFTTPRHGSFGFKFWSDHDVFETGHSTYKLNNETITDNYAADDHYYDVNFLGNNTISLKSPRFDIYYNHEFIAIERINTKRFSRYCGICSTGVLTATDDYNFENTNY